MASEIQRGMDKIEKKIGLFQLARAVETDDRNPQAMQKAEGKMIHLHSNLRLSFEQLQIKFLSILDGHREEIERLAKKAVDNFDFESAIEEHIKNKIEEGLEKAFSEIDLSERLKIKLWAIIEKQLEDK